MYTFVGFGELVVDKTYDEKGTLLKQDGGDTTWNILYHLGLMGEKTYAIGAVGNDENMKVAINSLRNAKVNTDYIEVQNKKTNVIYSTLRIDEEGKNNITFSEESPLDGEVCFQISQQLPTILPEEIREKNLIVILMDLHKQNIDFINGIRNKKVALDLGHVEFFEKSDSKYILQFLKKIDICQLNGDVVKELLKKLNVSNEIELYKKLNLELLIITYGKNGAKFLYQENKEIREINKKPKKVIENVIDTSGAGDGFLSVILKVYNRYASQNKNIDKNFVDNAFALANSFSCQIIQQIGCRGTDITLSNWLNDYNKLYVNSEIERY